MSSTPSSPCELGARSRSRAPCASRPASAPGPPGDLRSASLRVPSRASAPARRLAAPPRCARHHGTGASSTHRAGMRLATTQSDRSTACGRPMARCGRPMGGSVGGDGSPVTPSAWSARHQHRDRPAGDPFLPAERAEPFCSPPFHADRAPPTTPDRFSCIASRCGASLGSSQTTEQSTLPIDQPSFRNLRHDIGEDAHRVGSFPLRVGVGIVLTDVTETGSAEQGVGDGMGDHIGVAVPDEPRLRRGTRIHRARDGR